MRDDGTLWLNIGDSYCSTDKWGGGGRNTGKQTIADDGSYHRGRCDLAKRRSPASSRNLVGVPWMLAFALRADGWWLRSDIIWAKPNPMPEPVTDRPTKAHEYLFLLAKSKRYYYDADAIRAPLAANKRTVWTIATQPFKGSHFATFPPKLIEPCILASSRLSGVVLDPFMGSGTTAMVAEALGVTGSAAK